MLTIVCIATHAVRCELIIVHANRNLEFQIITHAIGDV